MYLTKIELHSRMRYILRHAENKKEIKAQIREFVQSELEKHSRNGGGDVVIPITFEDDQGEYPALDIIITKYVNPLKNPESSESVKGEGKV